MAHQMIKVLLVFTLLLLASGVDATRSKLKKQKEKKVKDKKKTKLPKIPKIPKVPKFLQPFPFHEEEGDQGHNIFSDNNHEGNVAVNHDNKNEGNNNNVVNDIKDGAAKPDFEIHSDGEWELVNQNSGVSAMHINLMPTNKIIVYDSTIYKPSRLNLPPGVPCVPYVDNVDKQNKLDCAAHSMEYDIETNQVKALRIQKGDPWCSSGGLAPDGTLVSTGGNADGLKSVRFHAGGGEWREYDNSLAENRWYATQQILPNGEFILFGGRMAYSYEFVPKEGQVNTKPFFFPFLYETKDADENNLYPFVHLSTDGNIFIFSNNRSLLLNPTNNKIVRTYPLLPGGSRNYPASGTSAFLPIDLNAHVDANKNVKAEVIICGGNVPDAFEAAEKNKVFLPALNDCNRLVITDPFPKWESEVMPSGRTMGDSLNLPNGQILFINGAKKGTAAWWDADDPNFTPVIYSPHKHKGQRFRVLKASQIARMYHSTSAVLPNGKIWVGGSNTHNFYKDVDRFPTETRVENFSPPYLDVDFNKYRPLIDENTMQKKLNYGGMFDINFSLEDGDKLTKNDIKVTMYYSPFTTHGTSMGQRLLVLKNEGIQKEQGKYRIKVAAPPSAAIAPPGYYLVFVVHRGVPGKGAWVNIQ